MYAFATIFSHISGITSIIGFVCAFSNPGVTMVMAAISLFASVLNVWFGDQNNFVTEIIAIGIGLLVALLFEIEILLALSAAICLGDMIISILGWISLLFILSKR